MKRCYISLVMLSILTMLASRCFVVKADENYPDRRALIVDDCSFLKLSEFAYDNEFRDSGERFYQNLVWTNTGSQPIVAFEVVILKYDAFDRRELGTSWTITGHNSADWSPLTPGELSRDAIISPDTEDVFTAIAYVRMARLANGKIWHCDDTALLAQLKKVAPDLTDVGSVAPDPKKKN